ncbi:unnamed protein product [Rhodiola kirilowii]
MNWLPGEPGKYVTILDLKERWMKQQEEKKRAEKEREEREAHDKVSEGLDELKIGGEKERVEAKRLAAVRRKSGGGGRVANRLWSESSGSKLEAAVDDVRYGDVEIRDGEGTKTRTVQRVEERNTGGGNQVAGSNSRINNRRRGGRKAWTGGRDGHLPRVSRLENSEVGVGDVLLVSNSGSSEYKKSGLQFDDVEINGDDRVANDNPKFVGRYHLGKRIMPNGSRMEARVGEFTENGNLVDQQNSEMQAEEVRNKGDEQVTKTNCPCHSRSENQHSGGYWVCKFIEPESGAEVGESTKGKEVAEGNVVDTTRKKCGRKGKHKKPELPIKVREEITRHQERKETMHIAGNSSRMINHERVPWKKRQPREKWEMANRVTEELVMEQEKTHAVVVVNKDNQKMIDEKNDVKLQMDCLSVNITEKSEAPAVTERVEIRSYKFGDTINIFDGMKTHGGSRFKTETNYNFLTEGLVKKEVMQVSSDDSRMVHQDDLPRRNGRSVDFGSDGFDKSKTTEVTEWEINSGTTIKAQRYGTNGRKGHNNFRFKTERMKDPKKFNGRMKEEQMMKTGLMWVKKGEDSVDSVGSKH